MDKSEAMFFHPSCHTRPNFGHKPSHVKITNLNKDHIFKISDSIRYLGVYFTPRLDWKLHVMNMANCTCSSIKGLSVLGNSVRGFSLSKWKTIYNTILLPTLTYSIQVWFTDKKQKGLINILQIAQNKACCKAAGMFRTTPNDLIHNLVSICHRRDDEPLDYRVLNRSTSRIAD
jgi:hypothetical protein